MRRSSAGSGPSPAGASAPPGRPPSRSKCLSARTNKKIRLEPVPPPRRRAARILRLVSATRPSGADGRNRSICLSRDGRERAAEGPAAAPGVSSRPMGPDDVARLIEEHRVETVRIGTPDMDGVYRGKRLTAGQFLEGLGSRFAQCDVLFGWDIAEEIITGAPLRWGSADTGFADVILRPDLATFRIVPWEPQSAAVVCDVFDEHGEPLPIAPRTVLRGVIARARGLGFEPMTAAEFEFRLFREDQESLRAKDYTGLRPLNPGLNCYSVSHASIDEDVVGALRRNMLAYGIEIEGYNRE